jgi:hypothetical protein
MLACRAIVLIASAYNGAIERIVKIFKKLGVLSKMRPSLWYTDIFFDDDAIDASAFDFFESLLDEGIVGDGNGEVERFSFPVAVIIIVQVFGVLISGEGVSATAGVEMIGGIFWGVEVMVEEGEMVLVDDFDHRLVFGVVCDAGVFAGDGGAGDELPGSLDGGCGCGLTAGC